MLCVYTPDTHLWRLFVVISVMNSQIVSFRILPKFIVDLPQSMLECAFNDAYSMLSVACDLAVDFEVYTLTNSDNVCDECCVLHVPRTRISNDESS